MFILDLLFALAIALILTAIFAAGFRRYEAGLGLLFFFIVLFLATWAGGIWITPFGPMAWHVPWLTFLFIGIIIALLLTALIPRKSVYYYRRRPKDISRDIQHVIALDIFFWILILGLLIAIVVGYM